MSILDIFFKKNIILFLCALRIKSIILVYKFPENRMKVTGMKIKYKSLVLQIFLVRAKLKNKITLT